MSGVISPRKSDADTFTGRRLQAPLDFGPLIAQAICAPRFRVEPGHLTPKVGKLQTRDH